ncbi:hypothetical protein M408DRAFT_191051 [Serendipita vermifera MAFF 305830]|uniref:Uncharacterized protein n=1 Tax=Serendipita vermifera MAFF 305830 TaxID=933852 RepID=A0A0C2XVY5_SERVB|nr:hypothetical protein M408DRAFT_191051 [Serendipita vermifera MAFF 305830]
MSSNAIMTRTGPIAINTKWNNQYVAPFARNSPLTAGFGSWLDSLNDITSHGLGYTALANVSPKSIWSAEDIPSPIYGRLRLSGCPIKEEPVQVVESNCELVHPRPRAFFVLTQQQVTGMEEQAEDMAKQRRRELRAKAKAQFERSDDDEIVILPKRHHARKSSGYNWAAAMAVLPRQSSQNTPSGPFPIE